MGMNSTWETYMLSTSQMPLTQQRKDASLGKGLNPAQDHKDGLLKESPKLLELACCSYQPKTLSYLQP
uniref:V-type proton ATPase subunit F n=1 Tax=Rhizophora mucronata TaxID=61149 RepID=A0A2P2KHT9_RHIMU